MYATCLSQFILLNLIIFILKYLTIATLVEKEKDNPIIMPISIFLLYTGGFGTACHNMVQSASLLAL
jgi:hypothetical protein